MHLRVEEAVVDMEKAIFILENAPQTDENISELAKYYYGLADTYSGVFSFGELVDYPKARKAWDRVVELVPDNDFYREVYDKFIAKMNAASTTQTAKGSAPVLSARQKAQLYFDAAKVLYKFKQEEEDSYRKRGKYSTERSKEIEYKYRILKTEYYAIAIREDPSMWEAYFERALELRQLDRNEEAVVDFKGAIALLEAAPKTEENVRLLEYYYDHLLITYKGFKTINGRPDWSDYPSGLKLSEMLLERWPENESYRAKYDMFYFKLHPTPSPSPKPTPKPTRRPIPTPEPTPTPAPAPTQKPVQENAVTNNSGGGSIITVQPTSTFPVRPTATPAGQIRCTACSSGKVEKECGSCWGSKGRWVKQWGYGEESKVWEKCIMCDGRGKIEETCKKCNGTGFK